MNGWRNGAIELITTRLLTTRPGASALSAKRACCLRFAPEPRCVRRWRTGRAFYLVMAYLAGHSLTRCGEFVTASSPGSAAMARSRAIAL